MTNIIVLQIHGASNNIYILVPLFADPYNFQNHFHFALDGLTNNFYYIIEVFEDLGSVNKINLQIHGLSNKIKLQIHGASNNIFLNKCSFPFIS